MGLARNDWGPAVTDGLHLLVVFKGTDVSNQPEKIVEAMLDHARLGNQPSETYFERLNVLASTIAECGQLSRSYEGIPSPTTQHYYASVLFTMLLTRATSLAILAPFSPFTDKAIEHWDYASATGIVRTMLELRLTFYYLCVERCSLSEWNCRWNIFNLHDCRARARVVESSSNDLEMLATLKAQAEDLRDRLRGNDFFIALPDKRQKLLLKGETAYLESLEDIGERAGVERQQFKHLYRLFSSHVHALPMSFYRVGDERGRGLPTPVEESYTTLCLTLGFTLLVHVRDEFQALFNELVPKTQAKEGVANVREPKLDEANLKIGETISLEPCADIRVDVTRTSQNDIQMAYVYLPTGDVVLRKSETDGEGGGLDWFDPIFWTLVLNGKPTTEQKMTAISGSPLAFKVDHFEKRILLKTE